MQGGDLVFPFAFPSFLFAIMSLLSATRAVVSPNWAVQETREINCMDLLSNFRRSVPSDNLFGSLLVLPAEVCSIIDCIASRNTVAVKGQKPSRLSSRQASLRYLLLCWPIPFRTLPPVQAVLVKPRVLVRSQRRHPGSCIMPPSTCRQPVSGCLPHGRSTNAVTGWSQRSPDSPVLPQRDTTVL